MKGYYNKMNKFTHRKKMFLLLDLCILVILIIMDLFTKRQAILFLKDKPAIPIIQNVLELQYLQNHGAAFGILQDQKAFFILIAILIVLIIGYVLFLIPDDKKYNIMHVLLTGIAAGACGNMVDRFRTGYVVDFIFFKLINFPIFNVADIYVTVCTFLLGVLCLFYYKEDDFSFLSFKQPRKYRKVK
jgi:signal peptidase II